MRGNDNSRNRIGNWWTILALLVVVSLLLSGCGGATPTPPKVYRVGILSGLQWFDSTVDGFKAGMTKLGYVEGQNIAYDVQKEYVDQAVQQQILEKFVADKVDLIFVFPTEASLMAKEATQGTNVPVLFAHAALEGNNLVESVRQPGGNITGIRYPGPDILAKRLEFWQELAPEGKRVLVYYDPNYPNNPPTLELLRPTASTMGITLVEVQATSAEEIKADLQARSASSDIGIDVILMMSEVVSTGPEAIAAITQFAAQHKVPILGGVMVPGNDGILLGYAPDAVKVGELAAPLVDKIFKGTPAGTIPVVSPESYLHFNYKQAQYFGLTVPDGLLAQAIEVAR
jgi:putative ABC transport system substrate-binding protein